jgi:O-glycosyl hydrolase
MQILTDDTAGRKSKSLRRFNRASRLSLCLAIGALSSGCDEHSVGASALDIEQATTTPLLTHGRAPPISAEHRGATPPSTARAGALGLPPVEPRLTPADNKRARSTPDSLLSVPIGPQRGRPSDLLWHNVNTGAYAEWFMAHGEVGGVADLYAEQPEWQVVGIGDFNGDRTSDVLWHNVNTGAYGEWLMAHGQVGGLVDLYAEQPEWQVVGVGDFNGDRTSDLLWHNVITGAYGEWLMVNGQVAAAIDLYTEPLEWQVVGVGDFNGDGTSDFFWHNVNTGAFAEWLMGAGQVAAVIELYTEPLEWQVVGIGDFNADRTSDVLWHNVNTGAYAEWLMGNGQVASAFDLAPAPAEWRVQGVGDFDGDGYSDILWRNLTTGEFVEWMLVDGVVALAIRLYTEPGEWQIAGIGDFDNEVYQPPPTVSVTLNPTEVHQTIDGFGVAQPGGDRSQLPPQNSATPLATLAEPYRSQVFDLAFSEDKGIGLTLLRTRVEGMMEPSPGVWVDEDPDQAVVMQQAAARGPVKIMASVWSPPRWMKDNGLTYGGRCSNTGAACTVDWQCGAGKTCLPASLNSSHYQEFANFLAHYAGPYAASKGVNIYAISMANEPESGIHATPDLTDTWDSCQWTSGQIADFLSNSLRPTFEAQHVPTKIIVPESATWEPSEPLMRATYATPRARDFVDIVAGHSYGGTLTQPLATARALNKSVWMTETSAIHGVWTMDSAVAWAKDIHDSLTGAQVNAWLWFILFAGGADQEGSGLIGGLPNGGFKASPSFYALGNFSKFVRPGYTRIGASATTSPLAEPLDVSAYRAGETYVVVAINSNNEEMNVELGFPSNVQHLVTAYLTGAGHLLEVQPYTFRGHTTRVPGKSIVTYVARPLAVQ